MYGHSGGFYPSNCGFPYNGPQPAHSGPPGGGDWRSPRPHFQQGYYNEFSPHHPAGPGCHPGGFPAPRGRGFYGDVRHPNVRPPFMRPHNARPPNPRHSNVIRPLMDSAPSNSSPSGFTPSNVGLLGDNPSDVPPSSVTPSSGASSSGKQSGATPSTIKPLYASFVKPGSEQGGQNQTAQCSDQGYINTTRGSGFRQRSEEAKRKRNRKCRNRNIAKQEAKRLEAMSQLVGGLQAVVSQASQ